METSRFPLADLEPGMILSVDILREGGILIEAGTEITERHLKQLAAWGLTEIEVRGNYPSLDRVARRAGDAEEVEVIDLSSLGIEASAPDEAAALPKGRRMESENAYLVESAPGEGTIAYDGSLVFARSVTASGDLEIRATGDVRIEGACTSRGGVLRIIAEEGDVKVRDAIEGPGVEVAAGRSVRAGRFVRARVRAGELVETAGAEGVIEGGEVEAGRKIRAGTAGNLKHEETNLTVTMAWLKKAFFDIQRLEKRIAERQQEVERLKKVIELVRMLGEKVTTLAPERKAQLAAQTKQFMEASSEIKSLNKRLEETRSAATGEVREVEDCPIVLGRIYPNVRIGIGPAQLINNAKLGRIGYFLKDKRIYVKTEEK